MNFSKILELRSLYHDLVRDHFLPLPNSPKSPLLPLVSLSLRCVFYGHTTWVESCDTQSFAPEHHDGIPVPEGVPSQVALKFQHDSSGRFKRALQPECGRRRSPEKSRTEHMSVFRIGLDSCLSTKRAAITNVTRIGRRR